MFSLLFLLTQSILTLFFCLSLLPTFSFPLQLILLMLKFKCLLCLRTYPSVLQLTVDFTLHTFRVDFLFQCCLGLDWRAEPQPSPIFQQKFIYLIILGFGPKSDLADLIFPVFYAFI